MVINCTEGMERKPQNIEVVVADAEKYLGVRDILRVTGCVKGWCPILSDCWPEVGLDRFKQWTRILFLVQCQVVGYLFISFLFKQRELYSRPVGGGNATFIQCQPLLNIIGEEEETQIVIYNMFYDKATVLIEGKLCNGTKVQIYIGWKGDNHMNAQLDIVKKTATRYVLNELSSLLSDNILYLLNKCHSLFPPTGTETLKGHYVTG